MADKEYQDGGYGVTYYKREICLSTTTDDGRLDLINSLEWIVDNYSLNEVYDAEQVKTTLAKIDSLQDEIRNLKRTVSLFTHL